MLKPSYYDNFADDLLNLYSRLDESITRDIARRIVKIGGTTLTDTAKWQVAMAQESGLLYDDIISKVAEYSNSSDRIIRDIFESAGVQSIEYDNRIYEQAGLTPLPLKSSPAAMQRLMADIEKTQGNINNLTKTTAISSQTTYINACSLAQLQVTSGAFSYQTAITNAVKSAIKDGSFVLYPSGHRDRLDVAVRRSVLTGVSQTCGTIGLMWANDMGCDLMEITAHSGARPSHAMWQGQIVSLSGQRGYLSTNDIGYGSAGGFKGCNCRHDWYPFFEGISQRTYSDSDLKALDDEKITYNDNEYSEYEITQLQRKFERSIRESKRRLAGYDEAIKSCKDTQIKSQLQNEFNIESVRLKSKEQQLNDFLKQTGQRKDSFRVQVNGFGKSTSQKAVWANKKVYQSTNNVLITKPIPGEQVAKEIIDNFCNNMKSLGINISGFYNYRGEPEMLDNMYKAYHKLSKKYPNEIKNLKICYQADDDIESFGWYIKEQKTIYFNKTVFDDTAFARQSYLNSVKEGFFPKGTTVESCFYHEFGHHFSFENNINCIQIAKETIFEQTNIHMSVGRMTPIIRENLSKYAVQETYITFQEVIAECFSSWYNSNENIPFVKAFLKKAGAII